MGEDSSSSRQIKLYFSCRLTILGPLNSPLAMQEDGSPCCDGASLSSDAVFSVESPEADGMVSVDKLRCERNQISCTKLGISTSTGRMAKICAKLRMWRSSLNEI